MFESSTLFYVILGILALITACLLLIAYEMTRREVGKTTSLHARKRSEALKECAYFFGFLSEQPVGKLIPDECFGCTLALSCIKAKKPSNEDKIKQESRIPVP